MKKVRLWQNTGVYYISWVSLVYLCVGLVSVFVYPTILVYLQFVYTVILSLPLCIRPLARRLNMTVFWERTGR